MKVLVTGASGFVGQRLIETLATDHEVWSVGRTPGDSRPSVEWIRWDMSLPLPPRTLPSQLDATVHLAQSRDYRAFPQSALAIARVNVDATLELLDHALQAGARKFVFASSGGIYGGSAAPLDETARVRPPDFYLSTKVAAETLAGAYQSLFDVVILRLFFVYGRGQGPDRFITRLVRRVLAGQAVVLHGPDGIRVNPVHVLDVVKAIAASMSLNGSHVVNVAGPDVLTLRALTEMIAERVGHRPKFEERPIAADADLVADTGLMERLLIPPRERFADRIAEVCEEALATPL